MAAQDNKKMHAFGAYQIIGSTMKAAKSSLGLKGDEKMTAALQDKIYQEYLIKKKGPAIYNYIIGKDNNINTAILAGAKEWAAIGVPHDMTLKSGKQLKKGQSYYSGKQGNKASVTPEEFGAGLKQQRERYAKLKKSGLSDQEAYTQSFKKQGEVSSLSQSAGQIVGGITDAAKTFFGKDDKKQSDNVVTKNGNVIPSTLAKPTTPPTQTPKLSLDPSKKGQVADVVKQSNNNKQLAAAGSTGKATGATSNNPDKTPKEKTNDNKSNKSANYDWDLDKLAKAAISGAKKSKPYGQCALYVRYALEKAQTRKIFSGGLGDAYEYVTSLPKIGWVQVGKNITTFKKGDIAVFPKSSSKEGHVCIFTGEKWVSDFVQKGIQPKTPGTVYEYIIYRAKSGYSNGSVETATQNSDLDSSIEKSNSTVGGKSEGSASEDPTTAGAEDKNFMTAARDTLTTGIASLATAITDTDFIKSAIGSLKNAKIDKYEKTKFDDLKVDTSHTTFNDKAQGPAKMQYKFGNGGGYNEDELFNPNLERQRDSSNNQLENAGAKNGMTRQLNHENKKLLENAGYIPPNTRQQNSSNNQLENAGDYNGMVRQDKSKVDWMENAGYIPPNIRQGDSDYSLQSPIDYGKTEQPTLSPGAINNNNYPTNNSPVKKKKLKWYEKLFGGKNSALFGDVASAFGFGGVFNLGKEIYNADKSGNLKDYGINKALDYMSNNQSMSAIGNLGKEIYNADKSGNLKDYGINKALDYMSNNQSNSLSDSTLAPNQTGIVKADSTSLFSDQPKSILDTINEQNTSSVGLYNQPSASLFSDQPKPVDKQGNIVPAAPVSAAMDAINLGKPIVNSGSIIDTITKNNKPLDGLGKVNGIMEAVAGDSKSLGENVDNNQMMQPQLNKRGTALMNLAFKDNENEKGAVTSLLNGVYGMSERIKSNPLSSKTGWGGFVNKSVNGFSDLLFGGGGSDESENQITGFNPKESIQLYNSNPKLVPNNADKAKVNGYVSSVNQQYQDMKDNKSSTKASGSSDNQLKGNANPGSSGKKSNLDGMSTNIVTRNPDSIFRSVSMSIMKTTLT